MILDDKEFFLTVAGLPTLCPAFVSGVSDYRDTSNAAANDGTNRKRYLNIVGLTNLTSTGADTLTITFKSSAAAAMTGLQTDYTFAAIAKGSVATTQLKIPLPEGMLQYIRIEWTVSAIGTVSAGGTFKAFLSES